MHPPVPSQFVGSREPRAAVLPSADVRLLACVRPAVRREVGGLVVPLATAGVVAGVGGQLPFQAVQLCLSLEGVLDSNQTSSNTLIVTIAEINGHSLP